MKKNEYARSAAVPPTAFTIAELQGTVRELPPCESALLALVEHYGELCRALLQDMPTMRVQSEALLCAAYALQVIGVRSMSGPLLKVLANTVQAGRAKFPGNRMMLASLGEELGELCAAFAGDLDAEDAKIEIAEEALQVAGIALRIYEEGDATFCDVPEEVTKP